MEGGAHGKQRSNYLFFHQPKITEVNIKSLIRKLPDPVLYRILAWKMYCYGERECRLLRKLVPRDKIALDIGANRGSYAYWLSKLATHVILFEPLPYLARYLERVSPQNVSVKNLGLSDKSGKIELHIPIRDGHLVEGEATINRLDAPFRTFPIKTSSLDEFELENIGFMKIDVEGHEIEVINGAKKTILLNRPIMLIEIEQRHITFPIDDVFQAINELGYDGYYYDHKKMRPIKTFSVKSHQSLDHISSKHYINNFIFFPSEISFDIKKIDA